ncbi:MAG: hypothetical protein K6F53_11675 [Lachnospiraceae bacterium]|nr:hypothetical protein [Lachnospiraceae bacterium]
MNKRILSSVQMIPISFFAAISMAVFLVGLHYKKRTINNPEGHFSSVREADPLSFALIHRFSLF